jgi:hypothetical protein
MAAAGLTALLALAVTAASLGYLHLAPTGLSPVRNAVSQYGITSFRTGYRVATISFGAAGVALAAGIGLAIGGRGETVVALLIVFAIARAAISWFPMDAPGADRTPTGQMHGMLAIGALRLRDAGCLQAGRRPAASGQVALAGPGFNRVGRRDGRLPAGPGSGPRLASDPGALRRDRARLLPLGDRLVHGFRRGLCDRGPLTRRRR